jgi:predicted ATPase
VTGVQTCALPISLAARLARGPLALEEIARVGIGIARGLACAHETGVIHRDLKPANVMIARDGTPKLVDFGLARPPERTSPNVSRESFTGLVVGTPGYMAPEQLRGDATDARTDLFALGVVLHELWTGKPPFGQSGLSAMALTLYEEPARLDEVRKGAPPALSELVAHLLQKEPGQRPASTREVATRLESLAAEATIREPALALAPPRPGSPAVATIAAGAATVAAVRVEPTTPAAIAPTIEVVRASRRPVESELSLLGREEDVAALESALSSGARLVTITGPPGIGKTALAAHLAARLGARGVRVTSVELGPVATQTELESALVVALRREGQKGARLVDLLALEEGLIFVDGGEAASSELATRVREWLASAPSVRFVLSRRNVLGLDVETVLSLGPLPRVAARELFRDRARRMRAGASSWSNEDLAAIDEIATLLEGSPLALSLAASRAALLSPREIASRLAAGGHEARLALLTDRKGTGSVKSLREAIAWSFALLSEDDARVLVRLSLFESAFGTQAAERIAHLPGEAGDALGVLDALESARAASLVRSVIDVRGEVRSVIEPNVRAFARARLAADPRARGRGGLRP